MLMVRKVYEKKKNENVRMNANRSFARKSKMGVRWETEVCLFWSPDRNAFVGLDRIRVGQGVIINGICR